MNKKDYLKYHQEVKDFQGKPIFPGDTVVINSYFKPAPYIGKVKHFTESGNLAILYNWRGYREIKCWAYRKPESVIKIKSGKRKKQ